MKQGVGNDVVKVVVVVKISFDLHSQGNVASRFSKYGALCALSTTTLNQKLVFHTSSYSCVANVQFSEND